MKPPSSFGLPEHMPVMNISDEDVGRGWRRVAYGELVRTHYQALLMHEMPGPRWRICSYFTDDGYHTKGLTHYRAPASIGAWLSVAPQVIGKWTTRIMDGLSKKRIG